MILPTACRTRINRRVVCKVQVVVFSPAGLQFEQRLTWLLRLTMNCKRTEWAPPPWVVAWLPPRWSWPSASGWVYRLCNWMFWFNGDVYFLFFLSFFDLFIFLLDDCSSQPAVKTWHIYNCILAVWEVSSKIKEASCPQRCQPNLNTSAHRKTTPTDMHGQFKFKLFKMWANLQHKWSVITERICLSKRSKVHNALRVVKSLRREQVFVPVMKHSSSSSLSPLHWWS